MFRVFNCLAEDHDWRFVVLAGVVCFVASLTAISLFHRAHATHGRARATWIAVAGIATGCGIWATHFVAMLAYEPGVATAYDIRLTALSLIAAVTVTSIGLGLAAAVPTRWAAPVGGGIVGAGVACMHYLGMFALELPGRVTWQPDLVLASIGLGMLFGVAALALAVRGERIQELLGAALLLTLAITAHHFTAMGAVAIVSDPTRVIDAASLSPTTLSITVAAAAMAILGASFVGALADRRMNEQELRLQTAVNNMTQGLVMFDASERLVVRNERYVEMYGLSPEAAKPGCTVRELLRRRFEACALAGDPEQYRVELIAAMNRGEATTSVMELADGRTIRTVNRPMPGGGWVGTHEDITDWKHREASFRLLFDNNPIPMWLADHENLRFLAVNDAAVTHYGYSREQFLSMTLLDIRPPENWQELRDSVYATRQDGRIWRHRKADGTVIDVAIYRQLLTYQGRAASLVAAIDCTERQQAEDEVRSTREFLNTVIENVPATILVKDARDFRYVLVNRAGEEFFGLPREQIIGKSVYDIFPKEVADRLTARDRDLLEKGQQNFFDEKPLHSPGKAWDVVSTRRLVVPGADGKPQYLLGVIEDLTERRQAEARIAHMAMHDALTDLPNRAAFSQYFQSALDRATASGGAAAVMCIDLDRFKEVNDVFGHNVGDALLCEVSRRLLATAEGAFVARLGGDEFTVVSVNGPQPATASALADRMQAAVDDEIAIDQHRIRIGLSIGIALYPTDGSDATALLGNADAALYRAKEEGRGSIRFFDADMDKRLRDRHALQHDLRSAMERRELLLHYQPQARIDGEITGFEALARWQHPQRGMVSPGTFIPIAEESGLIAPIGEWILREACREAASWQRPLQIAVNLSPVQIRHGDLPTLVQTILLETGLAPGRLELEITENVLIGDFTRAIAILRQLKALGVCIVMDDFGIGYSSLSYLQAFPFDKIKIDQSFISNLERNSQSAAIVRAVIGLGRGLNLPVFAEGVETREQLAFLVRENYDGMQGYLLGRPLPIEHYSEIVGLDSAPERALALAG